MRDADPDPAASDSPEERRVGRIVEVEAYIGEDDEASHARFGRTGRNAIMYGGPGVAYVYLVYGMYHCLNVVTEPPGRPAAVLIRALEPLEGADAMRAAGARDARRRLRDAAAAERAATRLADIPSWRLGSGPGLAAAAMSLDRDHTGVDMLDHASRVRLWPRPPQERVEVVATPRVGIGYAGSAWRDLPWRFIDARSRAVSGPRRR